MKPLEIRDQLMAEHAAFLALVDDAKSGDYDAARRLSDREIYERLFSLAAEFYGLESVDFHRFKEGIAEALGTVCDREGGTAGT